MGGKGGGGGIQSNYQIADLDAQGANRDFTNIGGLPGQVLGDNKTGGLFPNNVGGAGDEHSTPLPPATPTPGTPNTGAQADTPSTGDLLATAPAFSDYWLGGGNTLQRKPSAKTVGG